MGKRNEELHGVFLNKPDPVKARLTMGKLIGRQFGVDMIPLYVINEDTKEVVYGRYDEETIAKTEVIF